jgi:signal transduction histidine kinase
VCLRWQWSPRYVESAAGAGAGAILRTREESLLDFLQGTGLPLVARLGWVLRRLALVLAVVSFCFGALATLLWDGGWWSAALPWSGGLPALVAAPLYFAAYRLAPARLHAAAVAMFGALFCLSTLASWPRGAFHPAWYVQPILALAATCCLGVVPGLLLALVAVVAMLSASLTGASAVPGAGLESDLWVHTASLAALTLASALTGVLVHKVLVAALRAAEAQRRKNLESARALRYREKLLRHAMRVETVGDLAGLVTHQLRNAFQVMIGHVAHGAEKENADPAGQLTLIGETLQKAAPLLDQLMSLAHPEDGAPEESDLNAEIAAFFERARCVFPARIRLEMALCERTLPVLLSRRGLEHCLWNLASNARHAMPDGGTLTLTTGLHDGLAFVAMADTGCGIPLEVQRRIFDPYFTTKPPGEGTGLGLAAVERFVRASQGHIQLRSKPGAGATFVLFFPVTQAATVRSA